MVHCYWSKFSHVPFAMTTYFTGRLSSVKMSVCSALFHIMSHMGHYNVTYATLYVNKAGHALIGCGASHSWRDVFMSWHNCRILSFRPVPVKCKFLILFKRILVSNATKQMMYEVLVWHANIQGGPKTDCFF